MVDYLALRWGRDDASDRGRLLSYLQAEEDAICGLHGWWFLEAAEDVTLVTGQQGYVLGGPGYIAENGVRWVEGGVLLRKLDPALFDRSLRDDGISGALAFWCEDTVDDETGAARILVWRLPEAGAGTLSVVRRGGGNVLVDDGEDSTSSRVPAAWRTALLWGAEALAARNDSQEEKAAEFLKRREEVLAALKMEDMKHGKRG